MWAMTFRIFADGMRILPDGVIEHVSKAEAGTPQDFDPAVDRPDVQRVIAENR